MSAPPRHPAEAPWSRRRAAVVLGAALAGTLLTLRLGVWQLDRAHQKNALAAQMAERSQAAPLAASDLAQTSTEAEAQHWRRVELRGRWLAARTVFLDNRPMDGRPGFIVVTPLQLAAGDAVLVQRGWAPRSQGDLTALPPVATPAGDVTVRGLIAPPPSRLFEFAADASGPIRQNLDLASSSREIGMTLRPLSIRQIDGAADGLLRHWTQPAVDVSVNYGYAFQWFALAALIAGLYVWFRILRPRLDRRTR